VSGNGFAQIVDAPATIAAGGNGVFRVRLQSSTPGTYTGTVTINSNDPNYPVYTFTIQGTVTATSALSVQQGAATIANGSTFTFPGTPAGVAAAVTFTIRNSGTADLVLSNPAALVSGNGFSESQQPAATIPANGSSTFAVRILASTAGTYTGTVTITSNDPLNSPFSFTVKSGAGPGSGVCTVTVTAGKCFVSTVFTTMACCAAAELPAPTRAQTARTASAADVRRGPITRRPPVRRCRSWTPRARRTPPGRSSAAG